MSPSRRYASFLLAAVLITAPLLASGCLSGPDAAPVDRGDAAPPVIPIHEPGARAPAWEAVAGSDGRTGRYLIAPSDATAAEKGQCDLVLTGDGDAAAINVAIAAGNREIHFASGRVNVETTVNGASGVSLIGHGTTFAATPALPREGEMVSYDGLESSDETPLTTDATRGQRSVTVADTSPYAVGDLVLIVTDAPWKANERRQKQGELQWVRSITANEGLGFGGESALRDDYAVADDARVIKITHLDDVTITGITFKADPGSWLYGIRLNFVVNARIEDCTFISCEQFGVCFGSSLGCDVRHCYFDRCNREGYGYGVGYNYASEAGCIRDCTFVNCRHAIDIGGGSGYGIPRNLSFSGNRAFDCTDAAFSTHNVGEDILYISNLASGSKSGIVFASMSGMVINNTVISSKGPGIACVRPATEQLLVRGNRIESSGGQGIYVNSPNVIVIKNSINNSKQNGIEVEGYRAQVIENVVRYSSQSVDGEYDSIEVLDAPGTYVKGNTVRSKATAPRGRYAILFDHDSTDCTCIDNDVTDGGMTPLIVDASGTARIENNLGYLDK